MKIRCVETIETDDFMELMVSQMDREQLLQFIKELDLMVADWDFTDKLIDHFNNEKKKLKEAQQVIQPDNAQ